MPTPELQPRQWRRVIVTETGKICTRCGKDKPLDAYSPNRGGKLGLLSNCRSCMVERNRERKTNPRPPHRPMGIKAQRRFANLRPYGMTPQQYDSMLAEQGGCCAICGSTDNGDSRFDTFYVDHSHESGTVRGILCRGCNAGLGQFKDNPDLLLAAAAYLLQHTNVLGVCWSNADE